jgi:rubrerythrin
MTTLKGSKTEQNLLAAFAGESQARNRYSFAASVARKEGFEQISSLFLETADEEKQHAKLFLSFMPRTTDTAPAEGSFSGISAFRDLWRRNRRWIC